MHKPFLLFLLSLVVVTAGAQYRVTLRIRLLPPYHNTTDPVYIAGSFNNWNPAHPQFKMERDDKGFYSIDISVPSGKHEYKLTRGSWEKGESGSGGAQRPNRVLETGRDTLIEVVVQEWSDHFASGPKKSSASLQVRIMERSFYMPQLNRWRRIWIYLPKSYAEGRKQYPVLYMHDGQNVFEDTTAFSGEWGVDEALDTLGAIYGETIVVAIDNGGNKRLNEYSPFDMERFGKGEGDAYADFLVRTLMPYVNRNYRTRKNPGCTSIAGSSMGGLISLYTMLKYPAKFGRAGIFSPAFWIAPAIRQTVRVKAQKVRGKIYFFAGQQESERMVPDMLAVMQEVNRRSKAAILTVIRAEGRHDEATWRREFPGFYKYIRE